MATFNITLNFKDPEDVDITTGVITAIAAKTVNNVMKGTAAMETPGPAAILRLVANDYKIYYTTPGGSRQSIGAITVTAAASLPTLLEQSI